MAWLTPLEQKFFRVLRPASRQTAVPTYFFTCPSYRWDNVYVPFVVVGVGDLRAVPGNQGEQFSTLAAGQHLLLSGFQFSNPHLVNAGPVGEKSDTSAII